MTCLRERNLWLEVFRSKIVWDEFFLKTLTWGAIQRGCKVLRVVHSFLFYSIFTDFSLFILIWLLFVVATICVSHVWTMEFPVSVCQNGYKDQRTFRRWFMMIPSHLCCPLLWSHMKGWTASNMQDCPPSCYNPLFDYVVLIFWILI